jgi:hypothetical protein
MLSDTIIYTSAYWHPKVKQMVNDGQAVAVGITLFPNKKDYGYRLLGRILELAPNHSLFKIDDKVKFEKPFKQYLARQWPEANRKLSQIGLAYPDKAVLLLCFDRVTENPKDWCHRQTVGEFISEQTGRKVVEL